MKRRGSSSGVFSADRFPRNFPPAVTQPPGCVQLRRATPRAASARSAAMRLKCGSAPAVSVCRTCTPTSGLPAQTLGQWFAAQMSLHCAYVPCSLGSPVALSRCRRTGGVGLRTELSSTTAVPTAAVTPWEIALPARSYRCGEHLKHLATRSCAACAAAPYALPAQSCRCGEYLKRLATRSYAACAVLQSRPSYFFFGSLPTGDERPAWRVASSVLDWVLTASF